MAEVVAEARLQEGAGGRVEGLSERPQHFVNRRRHRWNRRASRGLPPDGALHRRRDGFPVLGDHLLVHRLILLDTTRKGPAAAGGAPTPRTAAVTDASATIPPLRRRGEPGERF